MNQARHPDKTSQTRILATDLVLAAVAACLPGMAWADTWTHDSVYGAATVVALPGGQAALARDGADQQARSITHVSTAGMTTTIARDYGPSGSKAVEIENGALRHHVYGGGLAPLLRVEGDGSLTYQVGADTVSVDATGSATVAHRIGDIKRSTVAVLDTTGQSQQRVAYSAMGQSTSQQDSGSAYAAAAQLAGYESLTAWQLGTDQLIDNRARLYASVTGRFLALDAAGQALGYEARGNDWITRADYDGYLDELVDALEKDRRIVVAVGEDHEEYEGIQILFALVDKLESRKIPFKIHQEDNLLFDKKGNIDKRVKKLGLDKRIRELYNTGRLHHLAQGDSIEVDDNERKLVLKQLVEQLEHRDEKDRVPVIEKYKYMFASSGSWDIPSLRQSADKSVVNILFAGGAHLMDSWGMGYYSYYSNKKDQTVYKHVFFDKEQLSFLQPERSFDLVNTHKLVGIVPDQKIYHYSLEKSLATQHEGGFHKKIGSISPEDDDSQQYLLFAPVKNTFTLHPLLKTVFKDDDQKNDGSKADQKHDDHWSNCLVQ